jgi:UDP-N-acetylglucosamine diphosphorylase / glucose-1-phosphate thymidylyltransferase / UDP-N-acetylgalactosamine diphosphorylase / glucosamine-1-phosphate N-acetyltransferase / galactosamine-1-phosphate N-acetyltransferase
LAPCPRDSVVKNLGVILAAGAGSRLGELSKRHSKPMVPVAGRPLIDWVIERLQAGGVTSLVVVRHADDEALAQHLAARWPDAAIAVQTERLGIADALCRALPLLGDAPAYLACACDSLFAAEDIAAVIAAGGAGDAVVGVLDMGAAATGARSAVRLDGDRIVDIVEKPAPGTASSNLVAAPLYRLPRAVDRHLAGDAEQGRERYVSVALAAYLRTGGVVRAVPLRERLEVTTADDVDFLATRLRGG